MSQSDPLAQLSELIGHSPGNTDLFFQALTHGSMGEARDYQRLEFLGDRVLGMVIGTLLYHRFPKASEGQLSAFLNRLVSREVCAEIARAINLGPLIRLGKQARDDGGADSLNILGDVTEALIGAIYLDAGLDAATRFIEHHWKDRIATIAEAPKHPKSQLQEWAAAKGRKPPHYVLVEKSGPHHNLSFRVSVEIKGVGIAEAIGASKQEAETEAARRFLEEYGL